MEITTRISHKWLERKHKHELASIIMSNLDRINLFADYSGVKSGHEKPLTVNVTGDGELTIRIGVNVLAYSFNRQEENNPYDEETGGFKRLWRVTDAVEFAKEVHSELCREEEDGSTPLTALLDKVCWNAIDNGCFGVEEDGRIDPPEDGSTRESETSTSGTPHSNPKSDNLASCQIDSGSRTGK
jgi:hypothetical protein